MPDGPAPLAIVFADAHYVVIDKPAGLLLHRSALARSGDPGDYALQRLRDQLGARVYPVHRLDRPTSGLVVFARTPTAAGRLGISFAEGRVAKRYLAVVRGYAPEAAEIDWPVVTREGPDPRRRPARTGLRRLATVSLPVAVGRYPSARASLVELRPETGRWRQLRQHCAHLRHPILGDTTHGDGRHNRLYRQLFGCHRLLLVAWGLAFEHPFTGATIRLEVPEDPGLLGLWERLGWGSAAPWTALPPLEIPRGGGGEPLAPETRGVAPIPGPAEDPGAGRGPSTSGYDGP